jgi:hypothetical protein
MATVTVPVFPQDNRSSHTSDTKYFYEALRIWQQTNQIFKTWDRLSQSQRGAIMRDAQTLKTNANAKLTIAEVLDGSRRSL